MKKCIYIIMAMCVAVVQTVVAQDASDIVKKLEENRVFDGIRAIGSITVNDKYGTRVTEYISISKGADNSLIEYTSVLERGQKVLRVGDKIYLYFPDSEEVQTLNKSMFQQGLLDSDISYEDLSGDKSLLQRFMSVLEKEEEKNGIETFVIYLSAKNDRKETYPYQRLWINKDNYSLVAAEYYTRRKKLRKTLTVQNTEEVRKGTFMATDLVYKDILKKGDGTRVLIEDIEFKKLSDNTFSVENLKF